MANKKNAPVEAQIDQEIAGAVSGVPTVCPCGVEDGFLPCHFPCGKVVLAECTVHCRTHVVWNRHGILRVVCVAVGRGVDLYAWSFGHVAF